MRHIYLYLVLLCFSVSAHAGIAGLWQTHDDDGKPTGHVRITQAAGIYTGKIEKGLPSDTEEKYCDACEGDRKGQRLIGMTILKKVTAKGNGAYQGKEILDPFSGKTYRVKLKLKETNQVLEVRGFVGLSLFGRTQLWKRVNDGE